MRPEEVLEHTLKLLSKKWKKRENDYKYIDDFTSYVEWENDYSYWHGFAIRCQRCNNQYRLWLNNEGNYEYGDSSQPYSERQPIIWD